MSRLAKYFGRLQLARLAFLVSLTFGHASAETFSKFSDFRYRVLEVIGGAKDTLVVVTESLTDAEIVTALYLAKYRGLDVKVFLGIQKAGLPLSRLSYLKRQNINTYLTPSNFPRSRGTVIYLDGKVLVSPNELDSYTQRKSYELSMASGQTAVSLIRAYQAAISAPREAIPQPLPNVGRPGRFNNYYNPKTASIHEGGSGISENPKPMTPIRPQVYGHGGGAPDLDPASKVDHHYDYDRSSAAQRKAPTGVPTTLPKQTIYQQKDTEQAESDADKPKL